MRHLSIAIDGPAGAGKSTVAKEVARRLGLLYVDTGAMYRAVAWLALRWHVQSSDEAALIELLQRHPLHFERGDSGTLDVYAEGYRINAELRSPQVSETVSQLSVHTQVRQRLTEWQRSFSERQPVVMDGRDIGTVVLPDADLKIFLTADLRARAERRALEFRSEGFSVSVDELQTQIHQRDARDSTRQAAPMRKADDAYQIDSTGKSIQAVVDEVLVLVDKVRTDDRE
jgi:cytidylate kinase